MNDKREVNSEVVDSQRHLSVVMHRIPPQQELMKVNRLLLAIVFALMTVVFVLGFALFPSQGVFEGYKQVKPYAVEMNPVLSAEINSLKGQVVGLISGSIESKLRALEESVRLGTVSSSLGTIEDLKNDIKVLRSYSEPSVADQAAVSTEQLMQEMSHLKNLIYVSLASCGLMLAAVAGVWIRNRNRLPYTDAKKAYLSSPSDRD